MKYILNTIGFKDQLDQGVSQKDLVPSVKEMGFDVIEVRNEFLTGDESELVDICKAANESGLDVFYSVNDVLINDDGLNPLLDKYVNEMQILGSDHLKMNIGRLSQVDDQALNDRLFNLLDGSFQLKVENNQTIQDSGLELTKKFLDKMASFQLSDVSYCFDIANWAWLDASPADAADVLAPYTTYLHMKNYQNSQEQLSVTSLEEGELNWRQLIQKFDDISEVGLEYAGDVSTIKQDLKLLKQIYG